MTSLLLDLLPHSITRLLSRFLPNSAADTARVVFSTSRLSILKADPTARHVRVFYRLWTDPRVMTAVGFPKGLEITKAQIRRQIETWCGSELDGKLVVELKNPPVCIGECKLGRTDPEGISETDVKLLPKYWGRGYGTEIKQGLVDYLFKNTDCRAVKATPNKNNIASQKMQEAVGGKKVGEGLFKAATNVSRHAIDVPFYEYLVFREDWEKRQSI